MQIWCSIIIINMSITIIIVIDIVTFGWQETACEKQSLYVKPRQSELASILSKQVIALRADVFTCASTCTFLPYLFSWGNAQTVKLSIQIQYLWPVSTSNRTQLFHQNAAVWLAKQHQPSWRFSDEIISSDLCVDDNIGIHYELEDG